MYLLAIIFPPLAVLLCGKPFQALLNLVLTFFFWIPGIIHAVMVVNESKNKKNKQKQQQQQQVIIINQVPGQPVTNETVTIPANYTQP